MFSRLQVRELLGAIQWKIKDRVSDGTDLASQLCSWLACDSGPVTEPLTLFISKVEIVMPALHVYFKDIMS